MQLPNFSHQEVTYNLKKPLIVMYPLTTQIDYTELRYSLRSLEKHLTPPYEVVIVGDQIPDWLTNVTQIHLPDVPGRKQLSIKRKILAALEYAEEILFMNDDIYLLQTVDKYFPYYWSGQLRAIRESGTKPLQDSLEAMKKPLKHFDIHTPIIYKQDFKEVVQNFPEDSIIKSMYGNYFGIEGVELKDCKIMKPMTTEMIMGQLKGRPCFSTSSQGLKSALPVIMGLYQQPSKHEI